MSLFDEPIECVLTAREVAVATRAIDEAKKGGGDQLFLLKLLPRLDRRSGVFVLEDGELLKCARYSRYNGGSGGYQDRFKAIVAAARRAGWKET